MGCAKVILCVALCATLAGVVVAGGHKKERPSEERIAELQTITLEFEVQEDGSVVFTWTPATSEASGGVKLAFSEKHEQPLYPFDSYAVWMPGAGHTTCTAPNAKAASGSVRYYRVCSVEPKNHAAYVALSNVVAVPPVAMTEKTKALLEKKKAEHERKKAEYAKKKAEAKAAKEKKSEAADIVKVCPECGWKGGEEDNFCVKCGAKLKEKKQ